MEPTKAWAGDQMYQSYCASCHGENGQGNGPAAPAMKTPVPDLTTIAKRNGGKFPDRQLMNTIKGDPNTIAHGTREMPVWGPLLRANSSSAGEEELRVHNLVRYIEKLQVK
jgi:mono/diheme cytochrome c family protein